MSETGHNQEDRVVEIIPKKQPLSVAPEQLHDDVVLGVKLLPKKPGLIPRTLRSLEPKLQAHKQTVQKRLQKAAEKATLHSDDIV